MIGFVVREPMCYAIQILSYVINRICYIKYVRLGLSKTSLDVVTFPFLMRKNVCAVVLQPNAKEIRNIP